MAPCQQELDDLVTPNHTLMLLKSARTRRSHHNLAANPLSRARFSYYLIQYSALPVIGKVPYLIATAMI